MTELSCLPYGVGHAEEGVCLQVQMGPYQILLDCGLSDIRLLGQDSRPPADFVLCTHAHPDHARGLIDIHHAFPKLPIYSSEVTAQLLALNWPETYTEGDLPFCQALPWRTPIEFADGLTVQLWPAGHLPGAAIVLLTYTTPVRQYRVLYTGDFFLSNSRLVEGLPLEDLRGLKPDVLIVEGSYGTARHPHRRQQENQLAERLYRDIAAQRSILLPTPTLGLGQELLMLLRSHHHFTGRAVTIWVDPVVASGCDAYLDLLAYFPSSVQNFARHQPLFWDERILPRVRRITDESPFDADQPCIVVGHWATDLGRFCRDSTQEWSIFLPELEASAIADQVLRQSGDFEHPTLSWLQTLDTALERGQIRLETYLLSSHCDGAGTAQLIHNLRPQHVVLVHGSPDYLADLANLEELQSRYQLHLPSPGVLVELPLGETFIQPAAPESVYEGEIRDTNEGVDVTLPIALASDPRWNQLADTGIIEARWQGDDLVLRGVSQRDLLKQAPTPFGNQAVECCYHCRHMRRQRCWSPVSPLYGFKVTPDGYCPAFEAQNTSVDR